jgi:hypothetical protein
MTDIIKIKHLRSANDGKSTRELTKHTTAAMQKEPSAALQSALGVVEGAGGHKHPDRYCMHVTQAIDYLRMASDNLQTAALHADTEATRNAALGASVALTALIGGMRLALEV